MASVWGYRMGTGEVKFSGLFLTRTKALREPHSGCKRSCEQIPEHPLFDNKEWAPSWSGEQEHISRRVFHDKRHVTPGSGLLKMGIANEP
jgi:hypothetical protein